MKIKPRTTAPKAGNKYYIRKADGGYSPYNGNTKMSCYNKNLSSLPNCVSYAAGAFAEQCGCDSIKYIFSGNAEDWFPQAKSKGLKTGKEPKLGAIMCWKGGLIANSQDGCGHVCIVSQVNSDGSILTSESGWSVNKQFFTTKRVKGSDNNWGLPKNYWQFQGFIYCPDAENVITNVDPLEVDGIFGPQTTLYTQKRLHVKEDKKMGPETIKALQNFLVMPIKQCSGIMDTNTIKRLQNWLQRKGFYSGKTTGKLDSDTIKAWQTYLNKYFTTNK